MYIFICIYAYTPGGGICGFSRKKGGICGLVLELFPMFSIDYRLNQAGKCQKQKRITLSDKKYRLAAPAAG